jgi:hypothetical protein
MMWATYLCNHPALRRLDMSITMNGSSSVSEVTVYGMHNCGSSTEGGKDFSFRHHV